MGENFNKFELDVESTFAGLENLLISKQRDYGPAAINDSPGGPINGLRVRIHDKTSRLNHLISNEQTPNHESIRDTIRDIANYYVIWLMLEDGTWPK